VRVRVPASIANLGPGFDVLAMAVDLWLEAEAEPADTPQWRFEGEVPPIPNAFTQLSMKGVVRSAIPVGVGLGSSAAARLAACELSGIPHQKVLEAAVAAEGHPDNVFAAALGGIRLVYGRRHDARLPNLELAVALAVAKEPVPTEQARAVLPSQVPRSDAVFNAARTGLFVQALWSRQWDELRAAMDDRLHQPYRRPLYPWTEAVIKAAYGSGALGSAVCGAGPSVFALCREPLAHAVAAAMAAASSGRALPLVTHVTEHGMTTAK
jgi:homoserine kinase